MKSNIEETMSNVASKAKSFGIKGLIGGTVAVLLFSSYGYNEGGVDTRLMQPIIGETWIKEEGYYAKVPFLSRTREFNKTGTIAATDNRDLVDASSLVVPPMIMQFADSYEMRFEWSMRYELPRDDEGLESMYQDLKSQENLLGNTVMPFAQTMVTDSVNQMLGGEFAQGGKNSLRTLIDNQSQFGMYQTKVKKVKKLRKTGMGSNATTGGASTDEIEITKVIYLEDTKGKKLRTPLSLAEYGIKIVPNSIQIVDNKPVGELINYIKNKQVNIAFQIKEDEKQVLLAKQAQSAQLEGEKELVVRTNKLNIRKQEAIIQAQQRVAEAKLQAEKEGVERQKVADLAIIDKTRELQVARANEGIQKANAAAAKYEATAIKQKGFAQAAVKKADYAAIDKEILVSNNNKAVAIAMYQSNMVVKMPNYVNIGGEAANQTSVEQMSTLKMMEQLETNTRATK